MADRRRINGPPSGTITPTFATPGTELQSPQRSRKPNQLRKIYLETGVVPTAKGSAYLEVEDNRGTPRLLNSRSASLKLLCAIHGPKPLPRNSAFSSNLQLTVNVKFAPFATRQRRGYIRDTTERDLATQLETALYGAIIPDRWPKSAIDILITILESEEVRTWTPDVPQGRGVDGVGYMNAVSGCITLASAALLHARIDCLDLVAGGVAATVFNHDGKAVRVLDPSPSEDLVLSSVCAVGYMPKRDEATLTWAKGDISGNNQERIGTFDSLLDSAVNAAKGSHVVLKQVATDLAQASLPKDDSLKA